MDLPALHEVVEQFVAALQRHVWAFRNGDDDADVYREDAVQLLPSMQAIARRIPDAPPPEAFVVDSRRNLEPFLDSGLQLLGAIDVQMTLVDALDTPAPKFTHEVLHPWVWGAAQGLWGTGHFRNAVHAAATVLDDHLQAKVDRTDLSGTPLAREAFSVSDPEPGKPRLRFKGKLNDEMFKSVHLGAMRLAEGCFLLIRNSAAHRTTRLSETAAMEQLSVLSYLARLIDTADVEHSSADG